MSDLEPPSSLITKFGISYYKIRQIGQCIYYNSVPLCYYTGNVF